MMKVNWFRVYVALYFSFPIASLYLGIFTGIKVPIYIELVPVIVFIFSLKKIRIKILDIIFFISAIFFIYINSENNYWINKIDLRGPLLLYINYIILRTVLNKNDSITISILVLKILEYSLYLLLLEFIIINSFDIGLQIQDLYLANYIEAERLYENIVSFLRPISLFPGSHNAGLVAAICFIYLIYTKKFSSNRLFPLAALTSLIICFSITSLITIPVVVYILYYHRFSRLEKLISIISLSIFIIIIFAYSIEISQIKAYGKIIQDTNISFYDYYYIQSILSSMKILANNPLGLAYDYESIYGNEVYISRVVINYGIPYIFIMVFSLYKIINNIKYQDQYTIIYTISFLVLFISSFHYPSIIYYPINIMIPLAFIMTKSRVDAA